MYLLCGLHERSNNEKSQVWKRHVSLQEDTSCVRLKHIAQNTGLP